MKKLLLTTMVPTIIMLAFSCRNSADHSFKNELPSSWDSTDLKEFQVFKDRFTDIFNLPEIINGVDSFEFRFGWNSSLRMGKHFFVVRRKNESWSGFHYYFECKKPFYNS